MPPEPTASVPEILERVEVATHVGTPLTRAKVKPSVVLEMFERLFAVVVYKRVLVPPKAVRPVPPDVTGRADDSETTPLAEMVRAVCDEVAYVVGDAVAR